MAAAGQGAALSRGPDLVGWVLAAIGLVVAGVGVHCCGGRVRLTERQADIAVAVLVVALVGVAVVLLWP